MSNLILEALNSNITTKTKIPQAKEDVQEEREGFLNSLLASIEQTNEFLPDHMKISEKELASEFISKLQKGIFDESDKISIFESASFMQILSLLDKLEIQSTDVKLANLSQHYPQLLNLLKSEANFDALKGAKSLNELLDIAKDLGLNVKNVKIDRLLDLKASFPNLDKSGFFKTAVDDVFKAIVNQKLSRITKSLQEIQNSQAQLPHSQNFHTKFNKNENSLLAKTLQNLDLLVKDKKEQKTFTSFATKDKTEKNETEKNEELFEKVKIKQPEFEKTKNKGETKELSNSDKTEILTKNSKDFEPAFKDNKNLTTNTLSQSDEPLKSKNPKQKDKEKFDQSVEPKEDLKKSDSNTSAIRFESKKEILKEPIVSSQIFSGIKENFKEQSTKEITKEIKDNKEISKEFKNIEITQKGLENLIQSIKNKDELNLQNESRPKDFIKETQNDEEKEKNEELNSVLKDLSKTSQNQLKNASNPRETLQYFSQDLKEAFSQYKAPITKFNITLNPSNLGEVEVTLVQRGNNLHINFSSNTNAMQIFLQNQAEFKNSLVNMGFTGLEMNFSDQGKKEQDQAKSRYRGNFKEFIENNEEEKVNLELVLARYF